MRSQRKGIATSKSSNDIRAFVSQFNRAVSAYELRAIGGFTQKQIERAVREGILRWRNDGDLELN